MKKNKTKISLFDYDLVKMLLLVIFVLLMSVVGIWLDYGTMIQ